MMAAEGYDVCGADRCAKAAGAVRCAESGHHRPAAAGGEKRLFERHRAHDGEPAALAAARAPHFRGQCGKRRVNARAVVGAYNHGLLCLGRTERAQRDPYGGGGHRGGDEARVSRWHGTPCLVLGFGRILLSISVFLP